MARRFTDEQPHDGDCVLVCSHRGRGTHHFFKLAPDGAPFHRPDGSIGHAHWIVVCGDCLDQNRNNPMGAVTGDMSWVGDAPAITEELQ